jgi:hypothetical protein
VAVEELVPKAVPKAVRVEIDVALLAREVAEQLAMLLRRDGIEFTMDVKADKIVINVDIAGMIAKWYGSGLGVRQGIGKGVTVRVE